MNRSTVTIVLILCSITILLFVRTYLLIELGTLNYEYDALQKVTTKVKNENDLLRQEVLTKSSYRFLYDEATRSGFIPLNPSDYLLIQ